MSTSLIKQMTNSLYEKGISEIPAHITFEQYNKLRQTIDKYHNSKKRSKKREYRRMRDKLLISYLWELGASSSDICNIKVCDIDFEIKNVRLFVQKRNERFTIPLFSDLFFDTCAFIKKFNVKDNQCLFRYYRFESWNSLKKDGVWRLISKYAKYAKMYVVDSTNNKHNIHPRIFRDSLALYLIEQNVPIPIILARLCYSDVDTKMNSIMKVTTDMQRQYLENIAFREKDSKQKTKG